jgi:hypothetical protein
MKKANKYESLYRKNSDTGRVIIDIALENYLDFFHVWDNATLRKRDIHSELVQFLDLCSEDIPLRKKLEIVFTLDIDEISKEKENQIRLSYKNFYASIKRLEQRKTKGFIRNSITLLFISLILLTLYGLLNDISQSTLLSRVFLESLLIGGWVFTWEAVHLLFIDIIEPFRRRKETNRLLDAELNFRYVDKKAKYS